MAHLLMHSNGRVHWTGNLSDDNARGNDPRNKLYMGEVSPDGLLVRSTLLLLDAPTAHDEGLHTSHVLPFEDRVTRDIILPTRRYAADSLDDTPVTYTIRVEP